MNVYFHRNYGIEIVSKYRKEGVTRFGLDFYAKYGQKSANGCPLRDAECLMKRDNGITPTFWEFVQSIIKDGISDGHWLPISLFCR